MDINEFAKDVHRNAVEHGWWEEERPIEEVIALIHSEWSEALEEARADRPMVWYECNEIEHATPKPCDPKDEYDCFSFGRQDNCQHRGKKPEGISVELLDGCIRIFDYLGKQDAAFAGEPTLDYLIRSTPEKSYKMSLPQLIANLHLKTSQAYAMLRHANDDPLFGKRGYSILREIILISCAWLVWQGVDAEQLMLKKHSYNRDRPYKHGKKF